MTALVDENGNVLERYMYDAYGAVTVLDGGTQDPDNTGDPDTEWDDDPDGASDYDNAILFAGYYCDAETGLYHIRNRMYHAELGRFMQRDLLGYVDGMSLYEYCGSGPGGATDPMGLWTRNEWWGKKRQAGAKRTATAEEGDTLMSLALLITGKEEDSKLLDNNVVLAAGTEIDVCPLLKKLENDLRANVVKAAMAKKFARFPKGEEKYLSGRGMKADDVNRIFERGNPVLIIECAVMARVVMARGLITTLNEGEFDELKYRVWRLRFAQLKTPQLDKMQIGDYAYCTNDQRYKGKFASGMNVIKVAAAEGSVIPATYWGWDAGNLSFQGWMAVLATAYNKQVKYIYRHAAAEFARAPIPNPENAAKLMQERDKRLLDLKGLKEYFKKHARVPLGGVTGQPQLGSGLGLRPKTLSFFNVYRIAEDVFDHRKAKQAKKLKDAREARD